MFIQAGFNSDDAVPMRAVALVRRYGRRWTRPAYLMRWPSGDMAWVGHEGVSWGEQVRFVNFVHLPFSFQYGLQHSAIE